MKIQIPDDFDPEKIIRSGQCFRASAQPDAAAERHFDIAEHDIHGIV